MDNFEPAPVVQKPLSPSAIVALCLSYAFLVLTALAPQDAIAEPRFTVPLKYPQTAAVAQAPGAASFYADMEFYNGKLQESWFCGWPTPEQMTAQFEAWEAAGELPDRLTEMTRAVGALNSSGTMTSSHAATLNRVLPIRRLWDRQGRGRSVTRQELFSGPQGTPVTIVAERCIGGPQVKEALTAVLDAVRSYLTPPAPAN